MKKSPCLRAFIADLDRVFTRWMSVSLLALIMTSKTLAATLTWSGGGANDNWSTGTNWAGTAPVAGDLLIFVGTTRPVTNNDLTAGTSLAGIQFNNTLNAQNFTLNGNQITLTGNITAAATSSAGDDIVNTINLDIRLGANVTMTPSITNGNNDIIVNGIISETGGARNLTKTGGAGSLLTLTSANTFSGQMQLNSGTLVVNSLADTGTASSIGTGLGNSLFRVGNTTSTGTMSYVGAGDSSTNRRVQVGNGAAASSTGGATIQNNSGTGLLTFSNSVFNSADAAATATRVLTFSGSNTGLNVVQGDIINNNATGLISVTKTGSGAWQFISTTSAFSEQMRINNGALTVRSIANVGVASSIGTGAASSVIRFGFDGSTGTLIYDGNTAASTNRQVQIGNADTETGGATIRNNGSGLMTFTNAAFNVSDSSITSTTAARTLTLGGTNTGLNEIQGVISNNISSVTATVSLNKSDAGTWVLSAANTYTGTTSVDGGLLKLENANALPGGVGSSGTSHLDFDGGILGLTSATGDFTRALDTGDTGAGNLVRWTSGGQGGFAAFGGNRTVNFGGSGASVSWSNTGRVFGTGIILGHSTADSTVTIVNAINLANGGSFRRIIAHDGAAAVDGVMAGVLSSPTTRLQKEGAGTLALTAANTFGSGIATGTDAVTISDGTLQLGNGGATGSLTATGDINISSGAVLATRRSGTLTLNQAIKGAGSVTVANTSSGSTILGSNANTYSGGTTVSSGTLIFTNTTGSGTGAGNVIVASGATLAGGGVLAPAAGNTITVNGILSIGETHSTAQDMSITTSGGGSLILSGTGEAIFDLISGAGSGTLNAASAADQLLIGGTWTLQSGSTLRVRNLNSLSGWAAGDAWQIMDWSTLSGSASGTFTTLDLPLLSGPFFWDTGNLYTTGIITIQVPEPSRAMLLLSGLLAIFHSRMRRLP
jgi:fibronectin-binding autotransporter adhesin